VLERARHLQALSQLLEWNPVVALLGARQVGKTTLARQLVAGRDLPITIFDLENPTDLAALADPLLALGHLRGLVILDEIQRRAELFPVLRVLVDRPGSPARFLILGSASPALLRQSSESLAGRIAHYELPPFSPDEVGSPSLATLWFRGGFPRSFLAGSDEQSAQWRRDFVRTFLDRDVPALGIRVPPPTLTRFWSMLAHLHGGLFNAAEMARSLEVTAHTVRHYLEILTSTFVVRQLRPWYESVGKRQVKTSKIYVRDSGLLHTLLQIDSPEALSRRPEIGGSWEGFALEAVAARLGVDLDHCYFWRTHTGAELDLMVTVGNRRLGFELKRTSTPTLTRSMHSALADLKLDRLDVVYAGERTFPLAERVRAVPLARVWEDVESLGP
jgi:uncharacterized protein